MGEYFEYYYNLSTLKHIHLNDKDLDNLASFEKENKNDIKYYIKASIFMLCGRIKNKINTEINTEINTKINTEIINKINNCIQMCYISCDNIKMIYDKLVEIIDDMTNILAEKYISVHTSFLILKVYEAIPNTSFREEALKKYVNEKFSEYKVYYRINEIMDKIYHLELNYDTSENFKEILSVINDHIIFYKHENFNEYVHTLKNLIKCFPHWNDNYFDTIDSILTNFDNIYKLPGILDIQICSEINHIKYLTNNNIYINKDIKLVKFGEILAEYKTLRSNTISNNKYQIVDYHSNRQIYLDFLSKIRDKLK